MLSIVWFLFRVLSSKQSPHLMINSFVPHHYSRSVYADVARYPGNDKYRETGLGRYTREALVLCLFHYTPAPYPRQDDKRGCTGMSIVLIGESITSRRTDARQALVNGHIRTKNEAPNNLGTSSQVIILWDQG